jgi:O-antigen ligase
MAFGQAFAKIPVASIYILDAGLICIAALILPDLLEAASRSALATSAVVIYLGITALQVAAAGPSRIVLRQSVIGFYAIWVLIGIALAQTSLVFYFVRILFWGSLAATVTFGLKKLVGIDPLHIVDVAEVLYMGCGLLVATFAAPLLGRKRWIGGLAFLQAALICLSLVRSIWVALPLAIIGTGMIIGRFHLGQKLVRGVSIGTVAVVIGLAVHPSTVTAIRAEAASIVAYNSGSSRSDNNAKWRANNWRYAASQIRGHPVTGIGFGQPEVPPAVCATGCNLVDASGDRTVLAGADLHNSILAIPLRLGIFGLFAVVVLEVVAFARARFLAPHHPAVAALYACHLLTLGTALSAVVLEGPYMAIFFWLTLGLVIGSCPDRRVRGTTTFDPRYSSVASRRSQPDRAGRRP